MTAPHHNDHVLVATRGVAALVIPFLIAAFGILYVFPSETEALFAWKIQPTMSAMMLGATYIGGIYFFTRVLLVKKWHTIKVGFLPTMTFVSFLGIATILHWGRFTPGHISFIAWAGLYFTTPFIVLAIWLLNRGYDPGPSAGHTSAIPLPVRGMIGVIGAITLCIAIILFVSPTIMIEFWPWTLTPLTARVTGAMFVLPGMVGLGVAFDVRWSAARIILETQSLSILFILGAVARAWREFDWAKPGSWLFVSGLSAMLAGIVLLYLFMNARDKALQQNNETAQPTLAANAP